MKRSYIFFGLICVIATIFILSVGIDNDAETDKNVSKVNASKLQLQKLKIENAVADAEKAAGENDYRLLALRGYALEVPGTKLDISIINSDFGTRILDGTGDFHRTMEDKELNDKVRAYARMYNETIVRKKNKRQR